MHTNTVEHLTKKLKQKISNIYLGIRLRTKELWIWILLQSIVFQIWHLFRVDVQATSEWIITQSILCGMTKYTFSKYLVLVLCYNRVQRQIWVLILSKFVRINFYYPWNQKKTIRFLAISRGTDMDVLKQTSRLTQTCNQAHHWTTWISSRTFFWEFFENFKRIILQGMR